MEPPYKRQRANPKRNVNPAPVIINRDASPDVLYWPPLPKRIEILHAVDEGALTRKLLQEIATNHPEVTSTIDQHYRNHQNSELRKNISFHSYSMHVRNMINGQYQTMSISRQYDLPSTIYSKVCDHIQEIVKVAGAQFASIGTRFSGLKALYNIGIMICQSSNHTLLLEVRRQFRSNSSLVTAMCLILKSAYSDERMAMCAAHYAGSTFLQKMLKLMELAVANGCFDGVEKVVALLKNEDDREEEGNEDEDDYKGDDDDDDWETRIYGGRREYSYDFV